MDIGKPDHRFSGPIGGGVPPFRWQHTTTKDAAVFRQRLEAFAEHVRQKHHKLLQRVSAELLTTLVMQNPVGNPSYWQKPRRNYVGGHSRRNWQVRQTPMATEIGGVDPAGAGTTANGYAKIGALPVGTKSVFLVNPVPYMERLNRGWSRQAPAGWIDNALRLVLNKYRSVQ